ncbi:MAG: FAD-linked oxidase C-terminal domain-containing protein [Phycisphaerales bacterium]
MSDLPLEVVSSRRPTASDIADHEGIARELEDLIDGDVRFGHHDRMLYATDASIYQVEPIGVVIPRHVEDVKAVVAYCTKHNLPILPRGSGTSLAGQAVNRAVVLDFSPYCCRILAIDPQRRTASVEPGVVLDELNRKAASHGLMFGPDVATSTHATLGGMIGNNSAGAHSILYRRTVEHVEALTVLLADGAQLELGDGAAARDERVADLTRRVAEVVMPLAREIRGRYPKTLRRVNGYNLDLLLDQFERSQPGRFDQVNLAHLLCGAEGTLGITLRATVRLVSVPKLKGLVIVAFAELDEALGAVKSILQTEPAAVELIDHLIIDLARKNAEYRRYVDLLPTVNSETPQAVLYVEYFADEAPDLRGKLDALVSQFPAGRTAQYTEVSAMTSAWKLRLAGEPLLHGIPGLRKPLTFIEDAAVEPGRLAQFVREFRRIVAARGTEAAYYAHASVGCLHMRPLICLRDPKDMKAMEVIATEVTDLIKQFGGALSGEHGDGRARSGLLRRFYGEALCDAFVAIKRIFDPHNRMNPGNIVDPQPMTEALRVRPEVATVEIPAVKTYFRYDQEHGFGAAVEMCNGAGVCRKLVGGTMCPSYRALRDERHATRGRGNALRLAISGQLSGDGRTPAWDDPETIKTLDLCLSCKACKTECPSNVDIAKLKAEYTAQRYTASGGAPAHIRRFGDVRRISRIASALYPLVNAMGRFAPAASVIRRAMGIAQHRSLPRFGPSLYRWFTAREKRPADAPVVVLVPDCFTVYCEPRIGRAAVVVLEALGYRVVLPRMGCCGRAAISTGMLDQAQDVCREAAEALLSLMDTNEVQAIVGCEPGCISAIKDDWQDLQMGVEPANLRRIADCCELIEDFIEIRWDEHPKRPSIDVDGGGGPVLFHGHCHQKALWGVERSSVLLGRLFGDRLRVLDSGCCGMAGSFGYTVDHYELAMRIGELSLFPTIRAEPQAAVIAPGTSCRHQILDGTGRRAVHPIELVAAALDLVF